jgi:hypothetical protein
MEPSYNISLYPGNGTADGKSGDHIQICPAYNVDAADVEMIADLATRVIVDFFAEKKR